MAILLNLVNPFSHRNRVCPTFVNAPLIILDESIWINSRPRPCRLVPKCELAHLNVNANARDESIAKYKRTASESIANATAESNAHAFGYNCRIS